MNQRVLYGVLLLAVGCSSGSGSGNDGPDGATGLAGNSGNGGGAGQQGTGATSSGNATGNGGGSNGNGGGANGSGGGSNGSGGKTGSGGTSGGGTGNGGTTGTGGGTAGGAGAGTGGGAGGMGTGGAPDTDQSVLERNKHANRDGLFIQPTLTTAVAAKLTKDTGFTPKTNGATWASPLYLEQGPGGKGVFFAVTTTNDVYALDETTGAVVWTKNLGSSPTANGVPCGSIHPLGIISTPVIDAASRTIYVAGAIGTSNIARHEIHAFSVDDGTEKPGFPIVAKGTSGSVTFSPEPENQRSALSLVNGTLYVAYGGHVGDCGAYHGWVIGIDTKDPTKMGGWGTLGQGEGIWAPGGMASDGNGVFAVTGNHTGGSATDHMSSDSEEIVRITGLGVLDRNNQNMFFPTAWKTMDSGDQDFGSVSPVYISVPGATPANFVAAASKDGHLYLLDPANLGGMGNPKVDFMVASRSNSIHGTLASYTTAKGRYVVFGTDGNANCPAGGPTGTVVESVLIPPGSPPKPTVAWCASSSVAAPAPITTSTDGTANAIVWYMSGTTLMGVDGDTGKNIYTGSGANACASQEQWTSLIAAKGRIIAGSNGGMCSWSSK